MGQDDRKETTEIAGTSEGGKKAAATNRKKHGKNFYRKIGSKGGANGHTGGFAKDKRTWWQKLLRRPKKAALAGAIGGARSRRTKKKEV